MEPWETSPEPAPEANDLPLADLLAELLASSEPGNSAEEPGPALDFMASVAAPWAESAPEPPAVDAPGVLRALDGAGASGAEPASGDLSSLLMARLLDGSAPPAESLEPLTRETGPLELPAALAGLCQPPECLPGEQSGTALAGLEPERAGQDSFFAEPAMTAVPEAAGPWAQAPAEGTLELLAAVDLSGAGDGLPAGLAAPALPSSPDEQAAFEAAEDAGIAAGLPAAMPPEPDSQKLAGIEAAPPALGAGVFEEATAANGVEAPPLPSREEAAFLEAQPVPAPGGRLLGQEAAGMELVPADGWPSSSPVLAAGAPATVDDGLCVPAEQEEDRAGTLAEQAGATADHPGQTPEEPEAPGTVEWPQVSLERPVAAPEPPAEAPPTAQAHEEPAPSALDAAGTGAASGLLAAPGRAGSPAAAPAGTLRHSDDADEFELVDAEQAERFLDRLLDAARTAIQSAPPAHAAAPHAERDLVPAGPSPAGPAAPPAAAPLAAEGASPEKASSVQFASGRVDQPAASPRQADEGAAEGSPIPPAAALMALGLPERLRTRLESIGDMDRLLQSRSALGPAQDQGPRLLVFRAGEASCGLPLENVREVERVGRVTAVPGAPAFIKGLVNVRGEILPLLDLAALLGTGPSAAAPGRLIVAQASPGEPTVALLVDEFHGLAPIRSDSVTEAPQPGRFRGSLEHRGRQVRWLDPAAVFGSEALERAAQSVPGTAA